MVRLMSLAFCCEVVRCGQEVGGASWTHPLHCLEIVSYTTDTYSASSVIQL